MVFLVVVVLPVIGLVEVDSVTRAFCVVFLPARRDRRPGLRPVEVVGAVVVRVRAMMSYGVVYGVACAWMLGCLMGCALVEEGCFVEQTRRNVKLGTLTFMCSCAQCLLSRRMTADVGLGVCVRNEHRRNLEDVRSLAYSATSCRAKAGCECRFQRNELRRHKRGFDTTTGSESILR